MISFKDFSVDLGDISTHSLSNGVKTNVKYKVEWEYSIPTSSVGDEVVLIKPSCGCTADLKFSDPVQDGDVWKGKLEGTYTPDIGGKGNIEKSVSIYLNDGQPLYSDVTIEGVTHQDYNPNKAKIYLYIKANHV